MLWVLAICGKTNGTSRNAEICVVAVLVTVFMFGGASLPSPEGFRIASGVPEASVRAGCTNTPPKDRPDTETQTLNRLRTDKKPS